MATLSGSIGDLAALILPWILISLVTVLPDLAEPRLTARLLTRLSVFVDKVNDICSQLNCLNKSFNAAVGSAQSRLLPQGRRFAELAGQSGEIDVADQIDEVVREIQAVE